MKEINDIRDNEIRIIGNTDVNNSHRLRNIIIITTVVIAISIIAFVLYYLHNQELNKPEPAYFEPIEAIPPAQRPQVIDSLQPLGSKVENLSKGFVEIIDTIINDIPLKIYVPHNAELSLHIGKMDKNDTTVVFTAQAADVRADNGGIVGAFVLKGEPKAWGLSKKGFCATISGNVTIGVANNTPLFEEATETEGYFFRQYPLVSNGKIVENEIKGKSTRRGICDRDGEIFMVETQTQESFHDFSQALVDLRVDQAISLVGSSAYGWAVDQDNVKHEFGNENNFKRRSLRMPPNTSYIVWREKSREFL